MIDWVCKYIRKHKCGFSEAATAWQKWNDLQLKPKSK